jgi:hypothetical protein
LFLLKYIVVPSTLVILVSWLFRVPSIIAECYTNRDYMTIAIGILFNLVMILPSIYYKLAIKN